MRAADRHLTREQSSERKQLLILTDTAGLDEGDDRPTKTAQNQDSARSLDGCRTSGPDCH